MVDTILEVGEKFGSMRLFATAKEIQNWAENRWVPEMVQTAESHPSMIAILSEDIMVQTYVMILVVDKKYLVDEATPEKVHTIMVGHDWSTRKNKHSKTAEILQHVDDGVQMLFVIQLLFGDEEIRSH